MQLTVPTFSSYAQAAPHPDRVSGGQKQCAQDSSGRPLISVVTVCFNAEKTLDRTIGSIQTQSLTDQIEYIVVDGGSKDGTLDIIRSREDAISLWVSEPDKGIADAFNKGIALANGRFVALLNADDAAPPDMYRLACEALQNDTAHGYCFGDLKYLAPDERTYTIKGDPQYERTIARRMPNLNHPSVVVRREVYEQHGLFVPACKYAMDYELLLRFHVHGVKGLYVPGLVAEMAEGGCSDEYFAKAMWEAAGIAAFYGNPVPAYATGLWIIFKKSIRLALESVLGPKLIEKLRGLQNSSFVQS